MSFVSGGAKEGWLVVVVVVVLIQAEIDNQPNVYYYYTSPTQQTVKILLKLGKFLWLY